MIYDNKEMLYYSPLRFNKDINKVQIIVSKTFEIEKNGITVMLAYAGDKIILEETKN